MKAEQERMAEILLVEDNPGDVRLVLEALRESGKQARLRVAWNAAEAMALLGGESVPGPDLIIMDLSLPGRSGYEMLEDLKADEGLRHIPLVVLTSSDSEEAIQRAYALHANCCVTKPFDLERFIKVVQDILHFWLDVTSRPARRG